MVLVVASLLLTLVAGVPVDVKGTWEGKITSQREDGTTSEDKTLLILEQKDNTITGTVGGDESDRHPIFSGTIEGHPGGEARQRQPRDQTEVTGDEAVRIGLSRARTCGVGVTLAILVRRGERPEGLAERQIRNALRI